MSTLYYINYQVQQRVWNISNVLYMVKYLCCSTNADSPGTPLYEYQRCQEINKHA